MQAAIKTYEDERDARIAIESSRAALSQDLERVSQETGRLNDQVVNYSSWTCNTFHEDPF